MTMPHRTRGPVLPVAATLAMLLLVATALTTAARAEDSVSPGTGSISISNISVSLTPTVSISRSETISNTITVSPSSTWESSSSVSSGPSESSFDGDVIVAEVYFMTVLQDGPLLRAIADAAQIMLSHMRVMPTSTPAVQSQQNHPVNGLIIDMKMLQALGETHDDGMAFSQTLRASASTSGSSSSGAEFETLIGFTNTTEAATAVSLANSGQIPGVSGARMVTPEGGSGGNGLSRNEKIIIGCVVGIGVPLILLIVAIVVYIVYFREPVAPKEPRAEVPERNYGDDADLEMPLHPMDHEPPQLPEKELMAIPM